MTHKEEAYLQQLEFSLGTLREFLDRQQTRIEHLEQRLGEEQKLREQLEEALIQEQQKSQALLTAQMVVAEDSDWSQSYRRLAQLRRDLLEIQKLLELA